MDLVIFLESVRFRMDLEEWPKTSARGRSCSKWSLNKDAKVRDFIAFGRAMDRAH